MNHEQELRLKRATGAFIQSKANWDWFVTLTYPDDCVTPYRVEVDLRKWLGVLAKLSKSHVVCAFGIEEQIRGALHAHALVGFEEPGSGPSTRAGAVAWVHGEALVELYESGKGAPWYLAKKGRWGIMSACPRGRSRCRRGGGCPDKVEVPSS